MPCSAVWVSSNDPVQVSHIDVSKESPCGHGVVICFSVYCGHEAHFGELVDGQPADGILQNQLWVDTLVDDQKDQVQCQGLRSCALSHSSCSCKTVVFLHDHEQMAPCGT